MTTLIKGELNNCEKCLSCYGQYGKPQFSEYWCDISLFLDKDTIKEPKGVCQFCNPNTSYFIPNFKQKTK